MVLLIIAACAGLGWHAYKYYAQKGQIDSALIFSLIHGFILCTGIILGISWWANKPEKED